jgi:hypothetical protein
MHPLQEAAIERGQTREYPVNIKSSSEKEGTYADSKSTSGPPLYANFEALIAPLRQAVEYSTSWLNRALKAKVNAEKMIDKLIVEINSQNAVLKAKLEKFFQATLEE